MGRLLSIGEAAAVKGVSVDTMRRWEKEGKIKSVRTDGGHRRYDIDTLIDFRENRKTIAYFVFQVMTKRVFSARLYGSRSRRNQKILEKLIEAVDTPDKPL
ncbi:MAG: MerR family DNA-binding transcriptional regulator [Coleofasciculus sp.]